MLQPLKARNQYSGTCCTSLYVTGRRSCKFVKFFGLCKSLVESTQNNSTTWQIYDCIRTNLQDVGPGDRYKNPDPVLQKSYDGTRRNYRSHISRIIKYFQENFPEYHQIGVRQLTQEEVADRTRYHFNYREDLIYTGLNVQFFMYFLSSTDKRSDGKLKSHEDIRKYRDAILWGSKIAGQHLPSSFYDSMEVYLTAY